MTLAPYYRDDRATIYLGDCREVLPALSAEDRAAIDVVVADPPYQETTLAWDRWPAGWVDVVAQTVRLCVPLWTFGSMRMFLTYGAEFAGWCFAQDVVWEKHNGSNSAADRFRRVHELALQWYRGPWVEVWRAPVFTMDATARVVRTKKGPPQWGELRESRYTSYDGGPRLMRSVIRVRSAHHEAHNPTQKPLGILDPLLAYSLPPRGVVLDPMMGSGSVLRAALDRGERAIGIEVREEECEAAVARLAQGSLLGGR